MKRWVYSLGILALIFLALGLGLCGGVLLDRQVLSGVVPPSGIPADAISNFQLMGVVLINGGTASAAEIVAGALHDAQRAVLVGETTFGTGTVLGEFPLSDDSALLLATEEWLTPNGHVLWHQGLSPDVVVTLPPELPLCFQWRSGT